MFLFIDRFVDVIEIPEAEFFVCTIQLKNDSASYESNPCGATGQYSMLSNQFVEVRVCKGTGQYAMERISLCQSMVIGPLRMWG